MLNMWWWLRLFLIIYWLLLGIGPESKHAMEQGDNMEQEKKQVKEALICAYEKNISISLKSELCNPETCDFNKDASITPSINSLLFLFKITFNTLCVKYGSYINWSETPWPKPNPFCQLGRKSKSWPILQ